MSSVQDDVNPLIDDLSINVDDMLTELTTLNLKTFSETQIEELRKTKAMRNEMVKKRDALNKAINISERRIRIALQSLAVLNEPF